MSDCLAVVRPDRPLYRVGRQPDAWSWPDWAYAGPEGTFGNRWDDPAGIYRVLYACSQRVGAFVETLARFRPDLEVLAELAAIDGSNDDPAPGVVPRAWLNNRASGQAAVEGNFADVGEAPSLAALRVALASRTIHYGLADIGYVPWILRARSNLGVDLEPFTALSAWLERLSERPAVAAELELTAAL